MRKMLLLSILFSLVSAGLVFAATPTKTVTATFVSFKAADAAKKTDAVLVVKVGAKEESFLIDAKTVVAGKDKKVVDIASLKAGQKIEIVFTGNAKKVMTAVSVTLK
jgi:hypothetical protein